MATYGENIKKRRLELGMTQVDLAEKIGETKQTIWKYESGRVTNIPLPKVSAIAKALNCSLEDITGWETKNPVTESDGLEESIDLSQLSEDRKKLIHDILKASDQDVSFVLQMTERLLSGQ